MKLDDHVAIVTGGGSGIGRATSQRLAAAGARVVVTDVDAAGGQAAAEEVGGRYVPLDVTDASAWRTVVAEVLADEGRLDVAFLNAGVATGVDDVTALDDDAYRRIMGVNVDGVVFGVREVVPAMPDGGAIIATASLAGLTPTPNDPIYSATKHAVVGFMRSIAPALSPRGITSNAVCPGFADTPIVTQEFREQIDSLGVPLLEASEVADAVMAILAGGGTGDAWFVQPGRDPAPYAFRGIPGPRA